MTYTRDDVDMIVKNIKNWDRRDVHELRQMLRDLNQACGDGEQPRADECVEMSDLPTADIPPDVNTAHPVWVIDMSGRMLVGDDAEDITTLDEYRAWRDRTNAGANP